MDDKKNSEDNIDSLYKKLYRPELCTEPVTESEKSLKENLVRQLFLYGMGILYKYKEFPIDDAEEKKTFFYDVVLDSIQKFLERCKDKTAPVEKVRGYYASILNNLVYTKIKKLPPPIELIEFSSLENLPEKNKKNIISELKEKKEEFEFIEKCYKFYKTNDPFLNSMITQRLYEDLHMYFDLIDKKIIDKQLFSDSIERYTFIDPDVYNMDSAPTQKKIATEYLKKKTGKTKNEGRVSDKVDKFLSYVSEMYRKEG